MGQFRNRAANLRVVPMPRRCSDLDRAVRVLRGLPREWQNWFIKTIDLADRTGRKARAAGNIGKPVIDIDPDLTKGAS
jgi:hypothetical protein